MTQELEDSEGASEDTGTETASGAAPNMKALHAEAETRAEGSRLKVVMGVATSMFAPAPVALVFPNGRREVPVKYSTAEALQSALEHPVENVSFVGSWEAVWNLSDNSIEAILVDHSRQSTQGAGEPGAPDSVSIAVGIPPNEPAMSVSIGPASELLRALHPHRAGELQSLCLRNVGAQQHDQAAVILERVSNSVFFALDVGHERLLGLSRRREASELEGESGVGHEISLEFPRHQYDGEAMQLYWYAREASGVPLLQYLAYYQTIEFFYPRYTEQAALRRVENVLKHPAFSPHRPADIARVLDAAGSSRRGPAKELDQLKATIEECVVSSELVDFIHSDGDLKRCLMDGKQGVSKKVVSVNMDPDAVRSAVSDRLYEIRCRIVHTKAGEQFVGQGPMLLPRSADVAKLSGDIRLAKWLARAVLSASCSEFSA